MTDGSMERPVVVATFRYRHEAEFAHAVLEQEGIPSMLLADDAGGSYAGLSLSSEPRLLVRPEDEERARAVLAGQGPAEED